METENHNEEAFRKLLKTVAPESPDANFTQRVVDNIVLENQYAAASEELALKIILQTVQPDQPSTSFTSDLLLKLQPAPKVIIYKPVISRKTWLWVAACITLALLACLFIPASQADQTSRIINAMDQVSRPTYIISDKMDKLPELYSLAIIGLASLILFDYFLRLKTGRLAKS
ncbi:hypothetical protein [Dyadobacter psychrophilus]|uniref:Uncharacterized protein n=1 Tax=Dyadobacter psychrophilus TaxID=651661 RepID=A0A1T5CB98_9BACT|nr:hypothetical protein [Dyadobacter psychrophilus]SKB56728.1 hypothetical protein SAMN05660293_01068 [Dyadobacter psychrophilus]